VKTTEQEAWCAWHEHWVQKDMCPHCQVIYAACYAKAHLRFACATYVGVMSEPVKSVAVPG
jgi:hypothetical protein